MTEQEKDELLLTQVALMFQTAALQQMGKLKNPLSDTVERDLGQARISIDILDVLHRRMKGNLSDAEERMFTNLTRELRLNYVDEASKTRDQDSRTEDGGPASPEPPSGPGPQ